MTTTAEYSNPFQYGNKDGALTPEQKALPGHDAHPQLAMAAAHDYAGDVISRTMGLSRDAPNVGKSLVVGAVAGATAPFFLPLSALGGSAAGKIVVGSYNSVLAGTRAFGATAITQSGNPDQSGGLGRGVL
ncbi:hypothetical protein [Burkholderia cepacia]|uniref:hypothetical protein n=1 Tax=Burkholderia cepacia TaxID=292 RepID=UPI00398E87BE